MKTRTDFTGGILNPTDLRHSVDGGKTWHDGPVTGCCSYQGSLADDPAAVERAGRYLVGDIVHNMAPDLAHKYIMAAGEGVLRAAETGDTDT